MHRKWLIAVVSVGVLALSAAAYFFGKGSSTDEPAVRPGPTEQEPPVGTGALEPAAVESLIRFESIPGSRSGVDFTYYGNPSDEHYMFEQNGGGCALLDYDCDGLIDLYFANGSHFLRPAEPAGASHRLYHSLGEFKFRDITSAAGLEAFGFGQGSAAADYDNDGFIDLFLACYGLNRFWHNNGDGTYEEITQQAGVGDERWASSAAFADLDGDGNLDLYVVNYLDWTPDSKTQTRRRLPSPMDYPGTPDLLYRNAGDGTFEQVGAAAGVSIPGDGKGLALAIADFNVDGLLDVYVANDTTRNFLFRNLGQLRFQEMGVGSGVAVSQDGSIGSSMGVAVGDYNGDGLPDLFVTNFAQEVVDVFTNIGSAGFIANNAELGVDAVSRRPLNFGIVVADFDLDRWPDLFFANGHIWNDSESGDEYRMRPSLTRNDRGERFIDIADSAGEYFRATWLGRAAGYGDLDNDGRIDLVITQLLDPPAILRNVSRISHDSISVQFIGTTSSRQALGSRVEVAFGSGIKLAGWIPSGGSFQTTHDPRVIFPQLEGDRPESISIVWPDGHRETWNPTGSDTPIRATLIEGTGMTESSP